MGREFKIEIPDEVLEDLARRLAMTRWPDEPRAAGWAFGANLDYMRQLVDYWQDGFDWRQAEARLNRFSHFMTLLETAPDDADLNETLNIHYIHEKGSGENPLPLLLLHGWPGSVVEFLDVIEPLAHPERFGGDVADAFDVIAPSLPGFGFSEIPETTLGPAAVAGMFARLMRESLGYPEYVVQGGDWGGIIAGRIALDHPDGLKALHVNIVPLRPDTGKDAPELTAEEQDWMSQTRRHLRNETAYQDIQATKPQTLAYGLTDSPVGLAAWITEKFHVWTDPDAAGPPFSMDDLLTNIMVYWVTGTINASTRIYRGFREERCGVLLPGQRVEPPLGLFLPPNDLFPPPPASWLARLGNVRHETRPEKGGHFTALEIGPELIRDMRAFFRTHAR